MWPYTNDESNWLEVVAVMEATRRPLTVAEIERAARRERARMIAAWIKSGVVALREVLRRAPHRPAVKPGGLASAD